MGICILEKIMCKDTEIKVFIEVLFVWRKLEINNI